MSTAVSGPRSAPLPAAFTEVPLAHRALHDAGAGRPENSAAAVAAAVAGGWGIEIDLQGSADGAAMVFHDDGLERLTGATGPVRARRAAELETLGLCGTGETIPRLETVLGIVGGRVPLLIELKDQSGRMQGSDGVLECAVARALAGYGGPVAAMSFNPDMVAALAVAAPNLPRGLVTWEWAGNEVAAMPEARRAHLRAIADFARVGASFVSHHHRDLDRAELRALRAAGVPVLCWTVRSPAEEAAARRGADGITFEGYPPARA